MIVGPNIPQQNGLVIAFEGGSNRSFKGEPTTNIITNGNFSNGTTNWSLYSSVSMNVTSVINFPTSIGRLKQVLNCVTLSTVHGGGNYGGTFRTVSMTAGLVYTMSYYARSLSGNMNLSISFQSGSGDNNNMAHTKTITSEWKLYTHTATLNTAKPNLYFWNSNVPNGIFQITDIQIEQKAYATPFINGTRGNTIATGGGWRDLTNKGNHAELINSPKFTNNKFGGLSFDGTSAYASIPFNASTMDFSLGQTICMWIKPSIGSNTVRRNPYNQAYGGSGTITHEPSGIFNYYFGTNGGNNLPYVGFSSGFTVLPNELAFITVTRSQPLNICRWFKNGVMYTNTNAGGYATTNNGSSPISIGDGYAGRFSGEIYNVLVYNKYLTNTEIMNIYNSTYKRFT